MNGISQPGNPKGTTGALLYNEHHTGGDRRQGGQNTCQEVISLTTNAGHAFKNKPFQRVTRASFAQNTVECILDRKMSTYTGRGREGSSGSQFRTETLNPRVCDMGSTSLRTY